MRRFLALFLLLAAASFSGLSQIYSIGADPVSVRWKELESRNFRIVYPEAADSLAREYAKALESFVAAQKHSSGFSPNEMYRKKMPVILHAYSAVSNGLVTWAPRRMELYTTPESFNPEATPWITQLAVHEGRHVAQMQFPRKNKLFKPLEYLIGELSTGAASGIYPGPAFLEGDAVTAETALTATGRGRTADFLEYYHVALADSLYRNFWQWYWGSLRRFTPDYYRAGYMLVAGMRTAFDDPLFTRRYFDNINSRFLPSRVLRKTMFQASGKNFDATFRDIQQYFADDWAAADSARAPFTEGRDFVKKGRLYDTYSSLTFTEDGLYAIHAALDKATELVRIDSSGTVRREGAFSSGGSRLSWDRFNRRLVWTEYVPSALLTLKSWSLPRYMQPGGKPATFKAEGRFYNPVVSDSFPVMALVEYREDGSSAVLVVESKRGALSKEYKAPAGMQPVEPVWLGNELYVSAISEDGFSIYRLPDWQPMFPAVRTKINRLFSRDGLIWFTSDRSGVNELHSLNPETGQILQRTSLRFGGNEFAFSPSGDLYYCAPTADARIIRVLEADRLLSIPVTMTAYPSAIAEKLSAQEPAGAVPYTGPLSEGKRYPKFTQPVRFHSWAPLYVEYNPVERLSLETVNSEGQPGATVMFQNELGTSWGMVGVSLTAPKDTLGLGTQAEDGALLPVEFRPALHAQYVWTAWGPIVDFRADYNERNVHGRYYTRKSTETGMSFPVTDRIEDNPLLQLSAGISVPFRLNRGGWNAAVIPQYRLSWSNDRISSLDVEQFTNTVNIDITPHKSLILSKAAVRAYVMRPVAPSGIFPRIGTGGEIGFTRTHNISSNVPGYYYGKVYGYLPGLLSTHGIRLSAEGNSNYGWEGQWIKSSSATLQADYAFPFLSVDWAGCSPLFYVRNFEGYLHAETTLTSYEELLRTKKGSFQTSYFSASVQARLANLLWAPYDTTIGIRYGYSPDDPLQTGFSVVYGMDF